MNVSELHPEEALDLYEAGRLGPRELEALKAHLARCPSCAAHVQWRSDVQASLAEAGGAAEAQRLVAAALARQGISAPVRAEVRPAGGRRRWTMVAAIIAISLVSGAASAKFWPSIERMWKRLSAPARPAPAPPRPPRQVAVLATDSSAQPPTPTAVRPRAARPAPRAHPPGALVRPPPRRPPAGAQPSILFPKAERPRPPLPQRWKRPRPLRRTRCLSIVLRRRRLRLQPRGCSPMWRTPVARAGSARRTRPTAS